MTIAKTKREQDEIATQTGEKIVKRKAGQIRKPKKQKSGLRLECKENITHDNQSKARGEKQTETKKQEKLRKTTQNKDRKQKERKRDRIQESKKKK